MATAGLPLWSTTAASNATADPAVNMAEGMAPSAVNDGVRALMASVANWRNDLYGITTSGTSTAFTVATGSTFATAAAMSGVIFTIIPHATSGASPTLAVDGLTARAINQSTGVAIATGALILGTPYLIKYVHATTEFIVLGRSPVYTDLTTTGTHTQSTTGQGIVATGTTAQRPANTAGGFRYNSDTGLPEFNTGSGWFSLLTTLSGAQTRYGVVINGTISETHNANAVTFALKTLAGTDPSATDPVVLAFRNATNTTGNYVYRTVTAALSLTISSGSTMGFVSSTPAKLWLTLFDDAGTIRLGAINCVSGSSIYPLGQVPLASSTAEGGLGAADSAQVFYTGTAVTSKPYVILGYASYESGLTAGAWASAPTVIQLFGPGVPLPGSVIQTVYSSTTTTTAISTNTLTATALTGSITPTSKVNLIDVEASGCISGGNGAGGVGFALLYRGTGSTAIGNASGYGSGTAVSTLHQTVSCRAIDSPGASSSTQYGLYLNLPQTGTTFTFLGTAIIGTNTGILTLKEIMT